MIDTHAHLNFEDFSRDYEEVICRSKKGGVEAIINVGAQITTSQKAIEIAQRNKICWASIGIHPIHTQDVSELSEEELFEKLEDLAQNKKVVAIGETGLDYYHLPSVVSAKEGLTEESTSQEFKKAQKRLFKIHLNLAEKLGLPLILHCRDAYLDLLSILQKRKGERRGVVHCFCDSIEVGKQFLDLGFYIGFTGMITYPGNEYLAEVIKEAPLNKILAETDCPYLAPQAKRGERNEPQNVKYVIQYISQVKDKPFIEIERITDQNARILFSLNNV